MATRLVQLGLEHRRDYPMLYIITLLLLCRFGEVDAVVPVIPILNKQNLSTCNYTLYRCTYLRM